MSKTELFMLLVIQIGGMYWAWAYLLGKGASGHSVRSLVIFIIFLVLWTTLWPLLFVRILLTEET